MTLSTDLSRVAFYAETDVFARNANGAHYPQRSAADYDDTREQGGADGTVRGGVSGGVGGVVWRCFVGDEPRAMPLYTSSSGVTDTILLFISKSPELIGASFAFRNS